MPNTDFGGSAAKFSRQLIFEFCNTIGPSRRFAARQQNVSNWSKSGLAADRLKPTLMTLQETWALRASGYNIFASIGMLFVLPVQKLGHATTTKIFHDGRVK